MTALTVVAWLAAVAHLALLAIIAYRLDRLLAHHEAAHKARQSRLRALWLASARDNGHVVPLRRNGAN